MEKVDGNFYKIEGIIDLMEFVKFCEKNQKSRRIWLRKLALLENLNSYYQFAVSQMLLFRESLLKNAELLREGKFNSSEYDDTNSKSHSSAISFYSFGRICIESMRLLSKETILCSQEEEKVKLLELCRNKYSPWVQDFIKKRIIIAAHPHDDSGMIIGPKSWGSDGTITFDTIDLQYIKIDHDKYILDPAKDLGKL